MIHRYIRKLRRRISSCFVMLCLSFCLAACSNVGPDNVPMSVTAPANDTLKGFNKVNHEFNQVFDKFIMRPLANTQNTIVPKPVRKGFGHFIRNLAEPWTAINQALQLNFKSAWKTTRRFAVNTTIGVGGLWDQATDMGLERDKEDFGQTLAVWGVKPGPYLVLPMLGPTNLRDTAGFGIDIYFDPPNYIAFKEGEWELAAARTLANAVQFRSANYEVVSEYMDRENSYSRLKLFYEQTRAFQIRNGLAAPDEIDDIFVDDATCYPADEALEGDTVCEN